MIKHFVSLGFMLAFVVAFSQNTTSSLSASKEDFYKNIEQQKKDGVHKRRVNHSVKRFKRWESFQKGRIAEDAGFYDPSILFSEYKKNKLSVNKNSATGNWSSLGPSNVELFNFSNYPGIGRVNGIFFHPSDSNTFWVGTPDGGLWQTTNGGQTWSCNTDLLPNLGISDMAINPQNPNTMYVATGDKYGYVGSSSGFWGGTYSSGILKSTDGGNTWNTSGLSYSFNNLRQIHRLLMHPTDTSTLFAATTNGLMKTVNAGATWVSKSGGLFYDIEFNVTNPARMYASGQHDIYLSTDTGNTWTKVAANACGGSRLSLATTAADSTIVYALCGDVNGEVFKSTNAGSSYSSLSNATIYFDVYTTVLEASPTNKNVVFVGDYEMQKSTNGANSWITLANDGSNNDYIHVDYHDIKFAPWNSNVLFACTDGGVYKSADGGATWLDLSNGLAITQMYRLGGTQGNVDYMLCGAQDNGTYLYRNGSWSHIPLGDGMDCAFDPNDTSIYYVSYQNSGMYDSWGNDISYNQGCTTCPWVTTIVTNPQKTSTIYTLTDDLGYSTDYGQSWNWISVPTGNELTHLVISPQDTNIIYTFTDKRIYKTINYGSSWTDVTGNLPTSGVNITGITISDVNPNHVWISFGGFNASKKAYYSSAGGATWTSISTGIPNIPVNCILHQNGANDVLYAGTDLGVYYKDNTMSSWMPYNTGLPNVIVNEMEIQYGLGKLRAATFGRGLWETSLHNYQPPNGIMEQTSAINNLQVYPNPVSGNMLNGNYYTSKETTATITLYNSMGQTIKSIKTDTKPGINYFNMDFTGLAKGAYVAEVKTPYGIKRENIIR
ncbi:MAG: T9SS type A sorting domain-containing protein [Bacteroidetes bacterium]|nr:T9SS type A sorting domain-containing protein [Bacteroidota bacterium]